MAPIVFNQTDAHRAVGRGLQPRVNRRIYLISGAFGRGPELLTNLQPGHLGNVRRLNIEQRAVRARLHGLLVGSLCGPGIDEPHIQHPAQYIAAPGGRKLRIDDRIVCGGRFGQSRDRGCLGYCQFIQRFAEICFRRRGHTIGTLPQEDDV